MENRKQPITIDAYAYFSLLVRSSIGVAPLHLLVQMCWSTRYRQGRKSGLLGMTWQYSRKRLGTITKPTPSRYSQGINRSFPAWQLDRIRTIKDQRNNLPGQTKQRQDWWDCTVFRSWAWTSDRYYDRSVWFARHGQSRIQKRKTIHWAIVSSER